MKIHVLGKIGGVTGWPEACAAGLRSAGHQTRLSASRNPAVNARIEAALLSERLGAPMAGAIARSVAGFAPDLVLAPGAFEIPPVILDRIAASAGRPPLVGWVGDSFDAGAREQAARFDLVAYTDSGLLERHRALGFAPPAIFLPHAVDPSEAAGAPAAERRAMMVFVANPTARRRAILETLCAPVVLFGAGWKGFAGSHEIHARRVRREALGGLYARHLAVLNIRHEHNVLSGLNQRHFEPGLTGTPVVSDDQPDLALCFEPDREVLVWRSAEELEAVYARLRADPTEARAIGAAARRRVLAEHTYGARLETILRAL